MVADRRPGDKSRLRRFVLRGPVGTGASSTESDPERFSGLFGI
jgi:hypothetical protein